MLIEVTKIKGLPVGALQEQIKVGQVKDVVVNPESGAVLGILVAKIPFPFFRALGVSFQDIVEFEKQGVVINSSESVLELKELFRLQESLENHPKIIGLKAVTEKGRGLGKVKDLLLDTSLGQVVKFYLKDLWGKERVISLAQVVKITRSKVVIKNDGEEVQVAPAPEVETA